MSTVVAHAGRNSYYAPLVSSPCRRYQTRGNTSTTQATHAHTKSDHQRNSSKYTAVSLPLENVDAGRAHISTSLAVEEEMHQDEPVDTISSTGTAESLCLTEPTPGKSRMEFRGVRACEFELVERMVGEQKRVLTKPRLSYDYNEHVLTVDMPSTLHEEFLDHLKDCLILAIATIPYDHDVITTRVAMNSSMRLRLRVKTKSVTPDMVIKITPVKGPRKFVVTAGIGECALSETKAEVFEKVEGEIRTHPEVDFVVIIVVTEAISYACPEVNSTAWKTLRNGEDDDPFPLPLSLNSFLDQQSMPRSLDHPLTVADHDCCHIQSVEYYVWTKGDNGSPIDIRNESPESMAYGTLLPTLNMDAITAKLNVGLRKLRDSIAAVSRRIDPLFDCSVLQAAEVALSLHWHVAAQNILGAGDVFAHERYEIWHHAAFVDTDDSYFPSAAEHTPESEEIPIAHSRAHSTTCKGAKNSRAPKKYKAKSKGVVKRVRA
ncbi:hypothetical protein DFJ58DRAFT_836218 [Suillus subalutaceus]|uniref:uncharacterized protein n=1 Tax=Suillus subalutaceus TaxID=48586 RepID=UPI001B87F513|nr:uncharacterized protein DFJ58DRAFT_836218 [Suillus subalutaceus]KAG1875630.1 hypothetical protein DFJ58DRAFT_836218 [Suillus subalutaceus]